MYRPSPNPFNNCGAADLRRLVEVLSALEIPVERITAEWIEPGPLLESRPIPLDELPADPQEYSVVVAGLPLNAGRLVRTLKTRLSPHEKALQLFSQVYPTAGPIDWFSHALTLPAIRRAYEAELRTILG